MGQIFVVVDFVPVISSLKQTNLALVLVFYFAQSLRYIRFVTGTRTKDSFFRIVSSLSVISYLKQITLALAQFFYHAVSELQKPPSLGLKLRTIFWDF
jgi:hypothetical protein